MKKLFTFTTCVVLFVSMFCVCYSENKGKLGVVGSKIIEPAMIISREDASVLTGVSFGECTVKEQPVVGLKLCVYEKDGAFLQLGLTQAAFMDKKGGNTPESIYNSIKGGFEDAVKIEGVGDDNFIAPPGLHIMKDGYYMTISLGIMTKDREKLKAAGMKAVENLGKYVQKGGQATW
ncbi:MAG: hypothetical protein V1753_08330 [Pseudomonadota bacterium]